MTLDSPPSGPFARSRSGDLGVRIATGTTEIDAVQALRYRVFIRRWARVRMTQPRADRSVRSGGSADRSAAFAASAAAPYKPPTGALPATSRLLRPPPMRLVTVPFSVALLGAAPLVMVPETKAAIVDPQDECKRPELRRLRNRRPSW